MKIYTVQDFQYWYDPAYRCWFAAQFDAEGYQISETMDAHDKATIHQYIQRKIVAAQQAVLLAAEDSLPRADANSPIAQAFQAVRNMPKGH